MADFEWKRVAAMNTETLRNRELLDGMITLVLVLAYGMIFLAFFLNAQQIAYLLFGCIAISFVGFSVLLFSTRGRLINMAVLFAVLTIGRYLIFHGTVKFVDSLIVVSIIFFAVTVCEVQLNKRNLYITIAGAFLCATLLILEKNDPGNTTYQGWLRYVYLNSNTAATIALNLFALLLGGSLLTRRRLIRYTLWVWAALLIWILEATHSRSSFFAALLLVAMIVRYHNLGMKRLERQTIICLGRGWRVAYTPSVWVTRLLILAPIILIPILPPLLKLFFDVETVLLGKPIFSGRTELWAEAVNVAFNNLVSFRNDYTTGLNVALKLVYLSGFSGTFLFFAVFLWAEKKTRLHGDGKGIKVNPAYMIFCAIMFAQSTESTLVSGSFGAAYLSMSILGLSNYWRER